MELLGPKTFWKSLFAGAPSIGLLNIVYPRNRFFGQRKLSLALLVFEFVGVLYSFPDQSSGTLEMLGIGQF